MIHTHHINTYIGTIHIHVNIHTYINIDVCICLLFFTIYTRYSKNTLHTHIQIDRYSLLEIYKDTSLLSAACMYVYIFGVYVTNLRRRHSSGAPTAAYQGKQFENEQATMKNKTERERARARARENNKL